MLELALTFEVVRTAPSFCVVRAFENMLLVTGLALITVAEQGEWTADEGGGGYGHMSVAACILRAVAGHVVGAGRDAVVCRLVREVAQVAFSTSTGAEEGLADGDFGGVVSEAAFGAVRTGAWRSC